MPTAARKQLPFLGRHLWLLADLAVIGLYFLLRGNRALRKGLSWSAWSGQSYPFTGSAPPPGAGGSGPSGAADWGWPAFWPRPTPPSAWSGG